MSEDRQETPTVQLQQIHQLSQQLAAVTADKERLVIALQASRAREASRPQELAICRASAAPSASCVFQPGLLSLLQELLEDVAQGSSHIGTGLVGRLVAYCKANEQGMELPVCPLYDSHQTSDKHDAAVYITTYVMLAMCHLSDMRQM